MYGSFYSFTFIPVFGVVSVLDFGHSNRCVVVSHCCFKFHFPDDIWCGASFHMLIFCLYIFFGEVSVKAFTHFLIRLFIFLLSSFKCSLCILDNSPLSNVFFAIVFSHCVAYFLILLILSFTEQQLLILMRSSLFLSWLCIWCCI